MKKIIIIVAIIIIFLTILGVKYWNWKDKEQNQIQEQEQGSIDKFSGWDTYTHEKYGFELKFPPSWKGYFVNEDEYPNYSFVSFSFKDGGHQPFTIFQIVQYDNQQWETIKHVSSLKMLNRSDNFVLVCDGCCYKDGDFTGGGQFDEFQIERCKEVPEIIETFKPF